MNPLHLGRLLGSQIIAFIISQSIIFSFLVILREHCAWGKLERTKETNCWNILLHLKIIILAHEDSNSSGLCVVHTEVVKTRSRERCSVEEWGLDWQSWFVLQFQFVVESFGTRNCGDLPVLATSSQKWFVVDGMMACQPGRAYLCSNPQSHSNSSQSEIQVNRHFIIRGWKVCSV